MGNDEDAKSEKSASPATPPQDRSSVHVHPPDWATLQAYYDPRVALPPYYNSAMASGHAHHHRPPPFMWGTPQHMMSPYGIPYAAIYSHGGVYAHPAVPLVATPLSTEMPTKSTGSSDQGLMKKLKMVDGLGMSIGNKNPESAEGGSERMLSNSTETTEGSSDESHVNTDRADQTGRKRNQTGRKRSREETQTFAGKNKRQPIPAPVDEAHTTAPTKAVGESFSPLTVLQPGSAMPPEAWLPNERELKREKRKQSNRESARRSRLRKQAETEELAKTVESLTADNVALKSEINRLRDNSEKLRLENSSFMEKLKTAPGKVEELASNCMADPDGTENLLPRVNNSGAAKRNPEKKSGKKLHQLLGANRRADAVVAG